MVVRFHKVFLAGVVCALASPVQAAQLPNPNHYPVGRPTLECVRDAATRFGVPTDLMLGVQSIERGETGQGVNNKNSTQDLGAFQINTIHLPRIQGMGGSRQDVLNRGCYNATVASLLMSEALKMPNKQHLDFYTRASGYHSWTPYHNAIYRTKLVRYTGQWQKWLIDNKMGYLVGSPRV
ncbi:hypothetical protein ACFBZI_11295 [Moraxella sp. ZJ142]|uniref:hypothetical protein n=1 Tax=Moraxella marmotae TaxID=3344520 RepID=UPI0035D40C91